MFTTGEFSKIARVPRGLLRHYREIGLFVPSQSDSQSGYHYYSIHQLPDLNRILALRDLGFSLDQIQRTVSDNLSNEELRGMLHMRKAEVERTLLDELQKIRSIESRLQVVEQGQPDLEVVIKSIPVQQYLSTRFICNSVEHALHLFGEMNRLLPGRVGSKNLGEMLVISHSDYFRVEDANIEIGYLVSKPKNLAALELKDLGLTFTQRTLGAIETMATVVINQSPDYMHLGTATIGYWMEVHDYKIVGPQRDVWHTYPTSTSENPILELQIPVQRQPQSTSLISSTSATS